MFQKHARDFISICPLVLIVYEILNFKQTLILQWVLSKCVILHSVTVSLYVSSSWCDQNLSTFLRLETTTEKQLFWICTSYMRYRVILCRIKYSVFKVKSLPVTLVAHVLLTRVTQLSRLRGMWTHTVSMLHIYCYNCPELITYSWHIERNITISKPKT